MATFDVQATISSPPTRVAVTINKTTVLKMTRDGDENWVGSKSNLNLPSPFDATVAAVGTSGAPFTIEIQVNDTNGKQVADKKQNAKLSASGIQIVHIQVTPKS